MGDRDGAASAEIDYQNREPERRLAGGDGQYEHRDDLPDKIAERGAERDEIDVHRQQDQLDRHQDDDDILAVDEDAEHAEREEHRRNGEVMADRNHNSIPCPTPGSTRSEEHTSELQSLMRISYAVFCLKKKNKKHKPKHLSYYTNTTQ